MNKQLLVDVRPFDISRTKIDESIKENGGRLVYFALSVPDYENLSLNIGELKRYIEQQKTIIVYYEQSITGIKAEVSIEEEVKD